MLAILLNSSPTPKEAQSIKSAKRTLNKPMRGILNPRMRFKIELIGKKKEIDSKMIKIPNPTGCPQKVLTTPIANAKTPKP